MEFILGILFLSWLIGDLTGMGLVSGFWLIVIFVGFLIASLL